MRRKERSDWGLRDSGLTTYMPFHEHGHSQISGETFRPPVLHKERKYDQDGYGEKVVVEHRIPILEPGHFDPLAHAKHLGHDINSDNGHLADRQTYAALAMQLIAIQA